MSGADPRLILREDELDAGLELLLLAEAAIWEAVDAALTAEGGLGLGRSHWRAAFLLRRRPGLGVQQLGRLTSLSKQAASKVLADLEARGLAAKTPGDLDSRRRAASLTEAGMAFEAKISERLRTLLAQSYRMGGPDAVAGSRAILSGLAGGRVRSGGPRDGEF